jgi:hypothetical protein
VKYIREARMGRPKTYKTGAVVGSYPKPMLYFGFDQGGLDVVPTKATLAAWNPNDTNFAQLIKPNVAYEDIKFIKPGFINSVTGLPADQQAPITAIQYYEGVPLGITLDTKPTAAMTPFSNFMNDYNALTTMPVLPWRTILTDSLSGLTDVVLNWISYAQPGMMADARQWAGLAGGKIRQYCLSCTALPAHTVFLLHSNVDRNELTGEIREIPNLYSETLRGEFFRMFSQAFYSFKRLDGRPVIWVSDQYPVAGIGPRWPLGLPRECAPDFQSIYGKELPNG